ncbi:MAG: single-stranded-DNA-specific exonuclease RecJ, partial [Gemmatimonadetes bacterium]|nr:single-stranded-DNA-specific exonuclease RecJ [Gemmatimonadota bacterium]
GERILVHGDYDVDGVTAAALLTRWLRRLGGRVDAFAPHRLRDGYDLGAAGLERARAVGATVLVTVDCGIVALEAARAVRAAGIDLIVTDHHTPGAALPEAVAVVNPHRSAPDEAEPLCGAGVAFKLVHRLATLYGIPFEELLPDLDLVALATVADLVPLTGENRVLVRYGLRALERTTKPGLRALIEIVDLPSGPIDAGQVGFRLAPRINALGRLDDAAVALELLLTEDPDRARELAERAETVNRERQDEDRRTLDEALARLEDSYDPERDFGVVLDGEGWHPGVIGIVASRVVERVHRPVVLIARKDGRGRGSGRSIPGFHLHEALVRCSPLLDRFGGHRQAAGLDLAAERIPEFREAFNAIAREFLAGHDLRPEVRADAELSLADADLGVVDLFRHLGPHGIGNPRPVFIARGLRVHGRPREVGRGHLKVTFEQDGSRREAIGFGLAARIPPDGLSGPVDALFTLSVNEWRGRRSVQLKLRDLRSARETA